MPELLQTLRFVRGAVSTKDLVPEMKHFVIKNGLVRAFNGVIALGSPIDFAVDCFPKAVPLVHAIGNCEDVVSLGMTDGGRLRIESGGFKAYVECLEEETLNVAPAGETIEIDGESFLAGVKAIARFVGNDASRPWTNGILFRDQSAFATNNVCLVEYWLGAPFPLTINVPMLAIKEILRINEPPTSLQMTESAVTIHYEDGRWLRSQLYETEWPDLRKILDKPSEQEPVPDLLFEAINKIKPFTEKSGHIYFKDGWVRTHDEEGLGAQHEVSGLHGEGVYQVNMLGLLEGVASTVDFKLYPEPLLFYGDRLRGAIVGLRK